MCVLVQDWAMPEFGAEVSHCVFVSHARGLPACAGASSETSETSETRLRPPAASATAPARSRRFRYPVMSGSLAAGDYRSLTSAQSGQEAGGVAGVDGAQDRVGEVDAADGPPAHQRDLLCRVREVLVGRLQEAVVEGVDVGVGRELVGAEEDPAGVLQHQGPG